ncbi:MAG: nucleotidyltransferase domain-containing protein [Methylococcaceae bacterium]|nr:nucleotidyltransferase domain-containing protein [Methylococcaceae bacterium]
MTRQELIDQSEAYIRRLFNERIPPQVRIYLYGSRARHDNRWNSDYDLWIDADISRKVIAEITDQLDESFVPFRVDMVMTPQLKGSFAERVKQEATLWM